LRTLNVALLDLSSGITGGAFIWFCRRMGFMSRGCWLSFASCDGTAEFDPTNSLVLFVWDPRLGKQEEGKSAESPLFRGCIGRNISHGGEI